VKQESPVRNEELSRLTAQFAKIRPFRAIRASAVLIFWIEGRRAIPALKVPNVTA
jgi:hypothetical protein